MPVLQFKGKTAIENYHHTVPHHILEFDRDLSVLDKGEKPGLDGNLIIEGDNLLALKALLPTHAGRIKCIYIDPPYNTGNEGWVFNDNLTQPQFKEWIGQTVGKEGEDATRHDKWCCMIYPRLQLLRELLCEDGTIYVSIDDNEVQHLRMVMDEIFGAENWVGTIVVQTNPRGRHLSPNVATSHEYVVCYGRNKEPIKLKKAVLSQKQVEEYKETDENGLRYRPLGLRKRGAFSRRQDRPNLYFPIYYNPEKKTISVERMAPDDVAIYPRLIDGADGVWRWQKSKVSRDVNLLEARVVAGRNEWDIFERDYLTEDGVQKGTTHKSIWMEKNLNNEVGRETLVAIFGKLVFENPKPVALVKEIIRMSTKPDDVVLDSFAGSGTTGHAALELNYEDGGSRRFVLVQMPYDTKENQEQKFNICREVTVERVRRVIAGYSFVTQRGRKEVVDGLGGSFSFAHVGASLFGEYRDIGQTPPAYEELAKYIFYTETSKEFDQAAVNQKTGKIGEYRSTSYYLLYSPNGKEGRALDLEWLASTGKSDQNTNLVVYCEKLWVHRDDLARYEAESGHKVRPMLVPFNLK
jgi:adenine-specific DNA-methyltransferase